MHCFRKVRIETFELILLFKNGYDKRALLFTIFYVPSPVKKILQYADPVIGLFLYIETHTHNILEINGKGLIWYIHYTL
jgi:hypothetical protein